MLKDWHVWKRNEFRGSSRMIHGIWMVKEKNVIFFSIKGLRTILCSDNRDFTVCAKQIRSCR